VSDSFSQSNILSPAGGPSKIPKSWLQQRREMLQLDLRCQLTAAEYRLYRFYNQDKDYAYMLNFLPSNEQRNTFQAALNDPNWKVLLDNKWLFHMHYEQFGLPLPQVYGLYDQGAGFTRTGKPLTTSEDLRTFFEEVRPSSLVAKPLGGIMGKQVLILKEIQYQNGGLQAVANTNERFTFEQLAEMLEQPPTVRYYMSGGYKLALTGYLLQEKLEQHTFLNTLAPYTTNTIRVVTFLNHRHDVDIHFTILRLGRQGNMADNWDRGGISIAIDPTTGVLGEGIIKPKYGGQWVQVHPDSGVRFTGQQIPYWHQILAFCTQAAKVTPKVRTIGWDVAITPTGPVLIEGNPDWDLGMVQVHTNGFLQPEVRAQLAHFGLFFPEENLPSFSPRAWWVRHRETSRGRTFRGGGSLPYRVVRRLRGMAKGR
jgi:hypothetical protein